MRRDEHPLKRRNPSGDTVYVARWTDRTGKRQSAGTFPKCGPCRNAKADGSCCAQHAIYAAYERDREAPERVATAREYAKTWLRDHPRGENATKTYSSRIKKALDIPIPGAGLLGDLRMSEIEPRRALAVVNVLLVDQGRAATGAKLMIATLSSMWRDAIDDGYVRSANPWLQRRIRADDPRVAKPARQTRVFTWEQMHAVCAAAGYLESMLRVLSDCGLRIGECFALQHRDLKLAQACDELGCHVTGPHLHVRRHAVNARLLERTKTGRDRVVPLGPRVAAMLAGPPRPFDARVSEVLLFPTATGRVWQYWNWLVHVWRPALRAAGVDATPHEFRHSWISYIRAAGVDGADAADAAGHSLETATKVYTHPLGRSSDAIRRAIGE